MMLPLPLLLLLTNTNNRWCVTYKNGMSFGRHGCFGRVRRDVVQSTVVTRAEPHNLQVCGWVGVTGGRSVGGCGVSSWGGEAGGGEGGDTCTLLKGVGWGEREHGEHI